MSRSLAGTVFINFPSIDNRPSEMGSRPAIIRKVVDFPHPEGPSKTNSSPWSIWMFTVPSLRAKECLPKEKDALNLLFLLVPLINVALPFAVKSFPVIFCADVAALAGVYAWKGVWGEVYAPMLAGTFATDSAKALAEEETRRQQREQERQAQQQ